jgi:hypothetical protein
MKTYGEVIVYRHSFLTSELGVSGQPQAPAALPPGKETQVPILWKARWVPEPVWKL